ncbi:hypothetical protein [Candidatus Mycoplasma mahonii]|uniref:hypothetical protein n=1 Tax=Candidatus Mycoplasma mahonii TaxID=3004105 RepID=UPI0026EEA2DA|nr:hypothetical protein [Candidatus Mycoplasma mahonii]WKX02344.1 hypothetical protein O3I44_02980 [Candidatus Mycoplasma mahonii]
MDEKAYKEGSIIINAFDNKFIENGVLLVNKESFKFILKNIDDIHYKRVLRHGKYKLDQQYQDRILDLRKLSSIDWTKTRRAL